MDKNDLATGSLLIVDDNREVLTAIRLLLRDHVGTIHTTVDPEALPALFREHSYDVILLDMNFTHGAASGHEGFRWLERIRQVDPDAVVVMITAYGDVEKAVQAMKAGAHDFVVKPWHNDKLVATVQAGLRLRRSRRAAARRDERPPATAPSTESSPGSMPDIIGQSAAMQRLLATIHKVAQTDANVLILGEHGTGKGLVAQAIHQASRRAGAPFVEVDLGALSENLFESELFGHTRGAFTGAVQDHQGRFQSADAGTLFLDEIGNIPLALQRKLLTVLERRAVTPVGSIEPRPVDIRLVSATNMPIYEMVQRGDPRGGAEGQEGGARFREDLLYRINTVEINLPPLRERTEDIPLLADYYLRLHAQKYDRDIGYISAAALERLRAYHWPGNIRELKHTLERAVILSDGDTLHPDDFLFSAGMPEDSPDLDLDNLDLEEIERAAIRRALSKHGGNISRAAQELGLTRRSLYRRIEKYGL